jgi:hypothetical protein
MNETYTVKFRCCNCQHKWEERVEKGLLVETDLTGTVIVTDVCHDYRDRIKCPNCNTFSKVIRDL